MRCVVVRLTYIQYSPCNLTTYLKKFCLIVSPSELTILSFREKSISDYFNITPSAYKIRIKSEDLFDRHELHWCLARRENCNSVIAMCSRSPQHLNREN